MILAVVMTFNVNIGNVFAEIIMKKEVANLVSNNDAIPKRFYVSLSLASHLGDRKMWVPPLFRLEVI